MGARLIIIPVYGMNQFSSEIGISCQQFDITDLRKQMKTVWCTCCDEILSLIQLNFTFLCFKSLSYIIVPKDKGKFI